MKNHLDFEQPIVDLQAKLDALTTTSLPGGIEVDFRGEADQIRAKIEETRKSIYSNLSPWQRVQLARHPQRPYTLDYIRQSFNGFSELHGDRLFLDDHAILAAPTLSTTSGTPLTASPSCTATGSSPMTRRWSVALPRWTVSG